MKRVLIIEDESSIAELQRDYLESHGFEADIEQRGDTGLARALQHPYDLVILDLMLPFADGFEICRRLRKEKDVPILMISAKKEDIDKIRGLGLGADDYMTKPFSPQELVSRIGAIFRRMQGYPGIHAEVSYEVGPLQVDLAKREVHLNGEQVELTPKEFELLVFLCRHRGKVLSRQQLLQGVWDYHFLGDTRIVDVHISHLRDKIEQSARSPEYIMTVRNVGYKLTGPSPKDQTAAMA